MLQTSNSSILKELAVLSRDQQLVGQQERFGRDSEFAFEHIEEWRELYPDHFVAVHNERLVAAHKTIESLRNACEQEGLTLTDSYVTFLTKERFDFVL